MMGRHGGWWLWLGLAVCGLAGTAQGAPPTVAQMLELKPVQPGVAVTTPTAAEQASCKVELVSGANNASGWVLKDGRGNLLRKFYDGNGDKYPDQWSYYKDGLEVYREVEGKYAGKPARYYQWLNTGGMKIGVSRGRDAAIDLWVALSVEELSQEVVKAIAAKDYRRLEPLLVSEEELKTVGAPAKEISRIKDLQKQSEARFRQTVAKLSHLNENTRWVHLETAAPSRLPADATGMKQDMLMYYRGMILCETAGKTEYIQLGEMVRVGEAWKLIDAPLPGDADRTETAGGAGTQSPELQKLLNGLAELDKNAPAPSAAGAQTARYHLARADLMEQIVARSPEAERGAWWRQVADSLSSAAQAGDAKGMDRLAKLAERLAREAPGGDTAAYVAFRELSTEHSLRVSSTSKPEEILEIQTRFMDRLAKFIAAYPKSEDAPDALLQLGMISEFQGKEAEAKKWYEQLVKSFAGSAQAPRAQGALRRLHLEGQAWELNAPVVPLTGGQPTAERLQGKVVVIYYWATWCQSAAADFARMKQLLLQHRGQLELVAINVDDNQAQAEAFVRQQALPGYQLHAGGGLDSPVAQHYGLVVFPNLFLIGRDGKVANRSLEVSGLEAEVKKLIK